MKYAEPRYTKDINLWISADPTNASAVYAALRKFGAPLSGITEDDFAHEGYFYQLGVAPCYWIARRLGSLDLNEHLQLRPLEFASTTCRDSAFKYCGLVPVKEL